MLTYTLDKQAGLSLYEQLYRRVKADILSGRLAAGEKLPSKRALAAHLEVSVITVKNAYEQLMAEGYLTGVEKKGYFVSAVLPSPAAVPASPEQPPPPREPAWFLDLATNSIAAEDFPFTVWARLMRQTILEQGTGPAAVHAAAGCLGPAAGHRRPPAAVPCHGGHCRADHRGCRHRGAVQPAGAAAGP